MTRTVRLVRQGEDQWLPLPADMHLTADRVRIRRHGRGIMIEPMFVDVKEWFAELDKFGPEPFPDVGDACCPTDAEVDDVDDTGILARKVMNELVDCRPCILVRSSARELMNLLGLSISERARELRVPVARIREIANSRRSITAETALSLRYFAMTPEFWMNLQAARISIWPEERQQTGSCGTCIRERLRRHISGLPRRLFSHSPMSESGISTTTRLEHA